MSADHRQCFLNLYGITQTWYGQPYTAESAIGLVFATGEIGPYLPETTSDENKVAYPSWGVSSVHTASLQFPSRSLPPCHVLSHVLVWSRPCTTAKFRSG